MKQNQLRVHCNPEQRTIGFITGFPFRNGFENVTTLDGAGGVPASFIILGTTVWKPLIFNYFLYSK